MAIVFSLLAGVVFGAGLIIADMVNPARVLNFLTGGKLGPDPLLRHGAACRHRPRLPAGLSPRRPLVGGMFNLPACAIDLPLIGGAAAFGVGWGLAGICPGRRSPIVTLEPKISCSSRHAGGMSRQGLAGPAIRDRGGALESLIPQAVFSVAAAISRWTSSSSPMARQTFSTAGKRR